MVKIRDKEVFMKKILTITSALLIVFTITIATANAEVFKADDKILVSADNNGIITISGPGVASSGITMLTQYCPDVWTDEAGKKHTRDDCDNNIEIKNEGGNFTLKTKGINNGQRAFNFNNVKRQWLRIPSTNVETGENVKIQQGIEGSMFLYTGTLSAPVATK
jgi:hypothetical protein